MRTGAARPPVSATVGPEGGRVTSGAARRPAGTAWTSRPEASGNQLYRAPATALTLGPVRRRAWAVATSAVHSSRPVGVFTRKATALPFGAQLTWVRRALAGRPATGRATPPSTAWKLRPVSQLARLLAGPLFCGLKRYPARRSMGSASSAMVGMLARSCSNKV
ncbi:hypothetical protein D3C80_1569380 [compost metagenome]